MDFKPWPFGGLSPYFIVENPEELVDQLVQIFDAEILRRFEREDGTIAHLELKIEESILMLCASTSEFPPNETMLHVYVPDVQSTFQRAVLAGVEVVKEPTQMHGDPDLRGSFLDLAGNFWSVATQVE